MAKHLKHYLLGLLLFWTFPLLSQTYFFEYIKKGNFGIANEKVYSVVEDKNHKIWMGTGEGLSTFDGKIVENFSNINGLAEKGVKTLYIDKRGYIWIGHLYGGLSRYDGKRFESRTDNLLFKDNDITSFCEDSEGNLWITSSGSGAIKIKNPEVSLDNLKYEQYKGNRLSDVIYSGLRLKNNKLLFITNAGIRLYNPTENKFDIYYIPKMPIYFQVTCILEDKNQNLWFGTYHGGLYQYVYKTKEFVIYDKRDGLASNWISTIFQDSKDNIWVGHYEGGGITRFKDGEIKNVFNKDNGLNDYNIYCISEDAEGNILIGTKDNGLAIFKDECFRLYVNDERIFPNTEIWSITEDEDKNIWMGTDNGIVIFNTNTKDNNRRYTIKPGGPISAPSQVRFLKKDKNKNIWIGTNDLGLFMYNQKTKRVEYPLINDKNDYKQITTLAIDDKNILWFGTRYYLFQYSIENQSYKTLSQGNGLISSEIRSIYIDDTGKKYIGSDRGITIFTDSLKAMSPKYDLNGATPNFITGDKAGNIWIGTQNRGVLCFRNGKIVKQYSKESGLLSDVITFVAPFNKSLYVGTGIGLNRIDLSTNNIYVYTKRNGLPGIETKNNSFCIDSQNTLWIGTVNGAVQYSPQFEKTKILPPVARINNFIANLDTLDIKKKIHLKFTQNSIIFEYSCVSLTNPDAIIYKVKLEGANNDNWIETSVASATYQALAPGKYSFKVMAKNYAGIWSETPDEVSFQINPPFYQTWWFISICIFIGLVSIFAYIQIRERNLVREKRILEEKVKERTAEVVKINQELAVKNKDITDSIVYASRIQNALLPPDLPFDNTFVVFKPKDIVSGDFFWFLALEGMEWFAAVDCTGHGVPGAFMSIIGHNSLNKILQEYNITKPSKILNQLNEEVSMALHHYHQDNQIHDGMDIALVSYDPENRLLEYSGAFNPLWLVRNKELIEIRANRYAIGIAPGIEKDFVNNEIKIESGDTIYLFSDGYADQFGGKHNKKMKIGVFKEIILSIQDKSMQEQKAYLDNFFAEWKNGCPQVDDVLVIGRRFIF